MKKYSFLIILFILILIAIAFKFSPFLSKSDLGKKIIEVTEINHAKEIQEVTSDINPLISYKSSVAFCTLVN